MQNDPRYNQLVAIASKAKTQQHGVGIPGVAQGPSVLGPPQTGSPMSTGSQENLSEHSGSGRFHL